MTTVVDWNGHDLPSELRGLPPGQYVVCRVDDVVELTEEEDEGLVAALESIAAGRSLEHDEVRARMETLLRR